jgi:hypothetical protein
LIATTQNAFVIVRSRSPMPLVVSFDSKYGQPLHMWTTIERGGSASRVVATGQRYGYCFSQAAGHGYAATRGCGTLTMHASFNGVRLHDGVAVTNHFYFLDR